MPPYTAYDIARYVDARIEGDGERVIVGVAPLGAAGPSQLTFLERKSLLSRLEGTRPGALLARHDVALPETDMTVLRVPHPQIAFGQALELFFPTPKRESGVHPTAVLGAGVRLGDAVHIGPHVVLEDNVHVGDRCELGPAVFLGGGVRLGDDCRIGHAASVLSKTVLGDRVILHEGVRLAAEGFGYSLAEGPAVKVPQIGGCVIGDDVEIGANSTVDRGTLGDTVIGARTKLDNLVHVGHNVQIGEDCLLVAQVGIAGSTRIGAGARLAGQVGVAGHLTIGPGARIVARAAVFKNVPAGATVSGTPARPHRTTLRVGAATFRLPEALARLSAIERKLGLDAKRDDR